MTHTIQLICHFFSLPPYSCAKYLTRIAYVSNTRILIPTPSTIPYIVRQWRTPKNQPPLAHTTTHNTHKTYNTVTMVPPSPWLPAALILQVSAIVIRRAINHDHCNMAMYFFLTTLTFLLFILLLFYVQRLSGLTD